MGDRTYVTLAILTAQVEEAKPIIIKHNGEPNGEYIPCADENYPQLSHFYFTEVNYGNLHGLDELIAKGIAFDSRWESGYSYGAGQRSVRFDVSGNVIDQEIYDSDDGPTLVELRPAMRICEPLERLAALEEIILKKEEELYTLPLNEKQIEYGKFYRTRQLIFLPDS